MSGIKNLMTLIKSMEPVLNKGAYVFTTVTNNQVARSETLFEFKEEEGTTIVLEQSKADELGLSYEYISSWISLKIHSSLDAVGLTAAFSTELTKYNISCNVVAGYYHDHIFVDQKDGQKAIAILADFSKNYS
jgi:hypothetical protein